MNPTHTTRTGEPTRTTDLKTTEPAHDAALSYHQWPIARTRRRTR